MTKRRTILAVVLGLIMALCLSLAVACGGTEAETEVVKWTINDKEHVTVTVNDSAELPETYTVGETLTFKVVPASGYDVVVKNGRTTLKGTDNVYSIEVKKGKSANDIAITVSRAIASVAVTKNPTRMTYYAGEFLDETGMEVSVNYATGESEKIEKGYVVTYPSGGAFTFGDTYFTVTYGGKTSEKVNLTEPVVGKITIDAAGGTIATEYSDALKETYTDIKQVTNENGKVTFTFEKALEQEILLPSAEYMTRGTEGDYQFLGWNNGSNTAALSIPAKLDVSVTYTAHWKANLVTLESIGYEQGEGEDSGKVFLVVNGTFRAANSFYLYFYEGNAKVELKGDTMNGTRGQKFTMKYDMNNLGNARWGDNGENDYFGKWMDIKFVAEAEGVKDEQEINLNDYAAQGFVDTNQVMHNDDYTFSFQVYTPDGSTDRYLKAVVNRYMPPITISQDGDNVVFSGTLLGETAQQAKTVEIDYWGSSSVVGRGTVEDGKYSVSLALADMPYTTTMYFHLKVLNEGGEIVFSAGAPDHNLLNSWIATDDTFVSGEKLGSLDGIRTSFASADNTRVLYIGYGEWGAIVGWLVNESIAETDATLEMKSDKGYYVVTGTWNTEKLQKAEVENLLKEKYPAPVIKASDFIGTQHVDTVWSRTLDEGNLIIEINDNGTFKVSIELPPVGEVKDGLALYLQYENVDGKNIYQGSINVHKDSPVTIGTMTYTLDVASGYTDNSQSWANGMILIRTEDSTSKSATFEKMALKVDNFASPTKVYYVVTVKVKNYTLDDVKKFVLGNIDSSTRDLYEQDPAKAKCVDEENHLYEIWFDVTECTGEHRYMKLFFMESGTTAELTEGSLVVELKEPSHVYDGLYAVVGGKKYSIVNKGDPYWDFAALIVTDAEEGDTNPPEVDPDYSPKSISLLDDVDVDLVEDGGKPCIVVTVRATGYTDDELKAAVQFGNVDAGDKDNPDDDFEWKSACIKVEKNGENYKLYFDLTGIKVGGDGRLWSNLFINDAKTEIHDYDHSTHGKYIIVGDNKYEIECTGDNGTWNIPCIKVGDPTKLTATAAELVVEDNKVYLSISGTASNGTSAETDRAKIEKAFSKVNADLQKRGDDWYGNELKNPVITINDDGSWTIKYDITNIEVHGNPYTCHFNGGDLKLPTDAAEDGKSVTLNGKKYTLVNKYGATEEKDNWGVVSVLIQNEA